MVFLPGRMQWLGLGQRPVDEGTHQLHVGEGRKGCGACYQGFVGPAWSLCALQAKGGLRVVCLGCMTIRSFTLTLRLSRVQMVSFPGDREAISAAMVSSSFPYNQRQPSFVPVSQPCSASHAAQRNAFKSMHDADVDHGTGPTGNEGSVRTRWV